MILYIHGFASSSKATKANLLRKSFNNVESIDLNPRPTIAIKQLSNFIQKQKDKKILLIGSSLGGYYSLYLSKKFNLNVVLVNPSLNPSKSLIRYANCEILNYQTDKPFLFKKEYLDEFKQFETKDIDQKKLLILLQSGDEILNYKEVIEIFPDAKTIVESGGSHKFNGFKNYFEMIREFYKR